MAHLWRWYNAECHHNPIRILLTNFRYEKCAHTRPSAPAKGVGQLETLQAIATFGLLSYDIQYGVNEFGALGVVTLGPVVTRTALTEYKVIRSKYLAKRTRAYSVHSSWLEIDQNCSWHVFSTARLVVINVYTL